MRIYHLRSLPRLPSFGSSKRALIGRLVLLLMITSAGCLTMFAQTAKPPRDDLQIWTETQVAIPLDSKVNLVLLGIVRFGRNVSRPVNVRIGAGVSLMGEV